MEKTYTETEVQDQMVMLILMDLVDHNLLTIQEADLARRIYSKKKSQKNDQADCNRTLEEQAR